MIVKLLFLACAVGFFVGLVRSDAGTAEDRMGRAMLTFMAFTGAVIFGVLSILGV